MHASVGVINMKGNAKVITALNERLGEELGAISQYMVHTEMCVNWGYKELGEHMEKIAKDEMRHAEMLISRIIFLEGMPTVQRPAPIKIGTTVKEMIANDQAGEQDAVGLYNEVIRLAVAEGDNGTREIVVKILQDEEGHTDWEEQQLTQIEQMGLENYLTNQV
jgi:bacterioferritin